MNRTATAWITCLLACLLLAPVSAQGQPDAERQIKALKAEIKMLKSTLEALRVENAELRDELDTPQAPSQADPDTQPQMTDTDPAPSAEPVGLTPPKELEEKVADSIDNGTNAARWGQDIVNPFSAISEDGVKMLSDRGIDVDALQQMKAVYITGTYTGSNSRNFVNSDPNVILVFGQNFITHANVYSRGPVLAMQNAHFMGSVYSTSVVWFVDESKPRKELGGAPIILHAKVHTSRIETIGDAVWQEDFQWTRPEGMLPPSGEGVGANAEAVPVPETLALLVAEMDGTAAADSGLPAENPFGAITEAGVTKLTARGVDVEALKQMKAIYITGSFTGANRRTIVNHDPNIVLIFARGFITHGEVYSEGPILAMDDAHFMNNIYGSSIVWFVDESFPRGKVGGAPVIVSPTAKLNFMKPAVDEVWAGDYGWRRDTKWKRPTSE